MNKILPGLLWHAAPIELTFNWINGSDQSNWKSHVYHSQMYNAFLIESNKIFVLSFQNIDLAWHIQVLWRKEKYLQLCYKFQKRPNLLNVLILRTNLLCSDMRKSDTRIWFCGPVNVVINDGSDDKRKIVIEVQVIIIFIYLFIYLLLLSFSC